MTGLLHALLFDGSGGARALDWAGVKAWSPNDGVLWINLDYTELDAKQWIETSIDPLVRDALLDPDPRPRAVAHGEDLLLIVRGINLNEGFSPEDMLSVRAFVEPRRIVKLSARSAEATNKRLYVLALITAVFLPLGFVCALFSVGVGGVPLKNNDWAFWGLVAAFAIFVAVQLYLFKKRGWL